MSELCILGAGRMGSALVGGLLTSGFTTLDGFLVVDPRPEACATISSQFPGIAVAETPQPATGAILAMKPVDAEKACRAVAPGTYERVLSIVAGVTLSSLEEWLWPDAPVIRAMPNSPALIGQAATAIAPGKFATKDDMAWAETVLSAIGIVVRLDESQLDAVTGLSGSGPAYVFYLVEALIEAGIEAGLDEEVARLLTTQMVFGAGRMLHETGESARELRKAVTSEKGTTEAGIAELDRREVREALVAAVLRAADRSCELGRLSP